MSKCALCGLLRLFLPARALWLKIVKQRKLSMAVIYHTSRCVTRRLPLSPHQDNVPDGTGGPAVPIEGECLLKEGSFFVDGSRALETIPLAGNRVNHVNLYYRLLLHIGDGSWRADIGKNDMFVIPDRRGPFRRKVRCAIRADLGNKAKPLLVENTLHIPSQSDFCFLLHKLTPFYFTRAAGKPNAPLRPGHAVLPRRCPDQPWKIPQRWQTRNRSPRSLALAPPGRQSAQYAARRALDVR
jgi:hypothetical protein